MLRTHLAALVALVCLASAPPASAQPATDDARAGTPPASAQPATGDARASAPFDLHAIPPILDDTYRHRSAGQLEVAAHGGTYLGASVGSTWMVGTRVSVFVSNTVSLGADYGYGHLAADPDSAFGRVVTTDPFHYVKGTATMGIPAAMRFGEDTVVEVALYGIAGGGAMLLNDQWEPMGSLGGGLMVFPGSAWFAFAVGVDTFVHSTSVADGATTIDTDSAFFGSLSFLFPTDPSPYER